MNLKEYLESDIIDFEVKDEAINECKKLFDKEKGIRSYMTQYAAYIIKYGDKKVTMINVFEQNFQELKAFKLICNKFDFEFEATLLNFENLSKQDNIIQTIKFIVATEECIKTKKDSTHYSKLINSKKIIKESKKRFEDRMREGVYKFEFLK